MHRRKSLFITLDGIDGCGKSTQLRLLADYLRQQGRKVLLTRDPGGPEISEKIRQLILHPGHGAMSSRCELMLYEASRAQLVEEVIRPALAAGKIVLCDRFFHATLAYQGAGRQLGQPDIRWLNRFATARLVPDLTFILDLNIALARARRQRAGKAPDRLEQETTAFHRRIRTAFLAQAQADPRHLVVIRGNRPAPLIQAEIRDIIKRKFGRQD